MKRTRKPTHPGAFFKLEIMEPLKLSVEETANKLFVSHRELNDVVEEKSELSPEMAKRFGKFTHTSTKSWYGMQTALDIWCMENSDYAENIKPYTR